MYYDKKSRRIFSDGSKTIEFFAGDIVKGHDDYNEGDLGVIVTNSYSTANPIIIWRNSGYDFIGAGGNNELPINTDVIQEVRRSHNGIIANFHTYDILDIVYTQPKKYTEADIAALTNTIKLQSEEIKQLKEQLASRDNIMEKLSEIIG